MKNRRAATSSMASRVGGPAAGWVLAAGAALQLAMPPEAISNDRFVRQRQAMVESQIKARGIEQRQVLEALATVPRHLFVPEAQREQAYGDHPLAIGEGQTISQPYIVALMTELLQLKGGEKVLEIGTGSGYHAAVLSRIAGRVLSIEIIDSLAAQAKATLAELGYSNVRIEVADGYRGWPAEAPYDAIILTAAPPEIPPPLLEQLRVGGRLVAPVGAFVQDLQVFSKTADGVIKKNVIPVVFVPMTGEAQSTAERRFN